MSKDRDTDRYKRFTRRALFLGGLQAGILGTLAARLAYLQVYESARYATLSDENRINMKMLSPVRGQIVDRFGVPLAVNKQNFQVLITPERADDIEETLKRLSDVIALKDEDIARVLKEVKRKQSFVPVMVREHLNWDQVARIEVNVHELAGVYVDVGEIRHYPLGNATAHVVGYVGAVSKADLKEGAPMLSLPGFRVGKRGIEKQYDELLRGESGTAQVEVNAVGREIRELGRREGTTGKRVTMTLDAELQLFMQERLAQERSATAVIMDVHTGAVYAMASSPGFDPNLFTKGIPLDVWEELLADPANPLTNKAIAGQYPPGSTFKMVTALAALEAKVIHPGTVVNCPGHYEVGRDRFHCWKRWGHGKMDLNAALQQSCDVYFYSLARDTGIDRIADMARRLGLGAKLGLDLPNERPGLIPTKEWKMGRFGERWQPGETVVASIGQGYTLTTPLQLAVMTARMVNGGYGVRPYITAHVEDTELPQEHFEKLDINPSHLSQVIRGMRSVVLSEKGTARASAIGIEGMEMGGKTGTAQVRRITREDRAAGVKNEDLDWQYRHHALFVAYAPVGNPRYSCAVVVEHGGSGSAAAAPLARDLMVEVQKRDPARTQVVSSNRGAVPTRPKRRPAREER